MAQRRLDVLDRLALLVAHGRRAPPAGMGAHWLESGLLLDAVPFPQIGARIDRQAVVLTEHQIMIRDGYEIVRPRDLADVRAAVSRSPAWLTGELGQLVADGILVDRERGVYAWGPAISAISGVRAG